MVTFVEEDYKNLIKEDHEFQIPKKRVLSPADMPLWENSEAYLEFVGFILALNEEVKGMPNDGDYPKSGVVNGFLNVLDTLSLWIDEIPPIDQPQRFGNQAFKIFYNRLVEHGTEFLMKSVPDVFHSALAEIKYYFFEGFGNSTRIDYGTGHEMSFCMYLCSLFKIGALKQTDKKAAVCYIFKSYLDVCRKLQTVYNMEPAGSRGVWALDDFQFLPFLWGSSQLMGHSSVEPSKFYLEDIVNANSEKYLFLGCIKYINSVKKGPFSEHSNQLWNISAVSSWGKVNTGLIRMYKAEVLAKFPVIQHVLFGTILPLVKSSQPAPGFRTPLSLRPGGPRPPPGGPSLASEVRPPPEN